MREQAPELCKSLYEACGTGEEELAALAKRVVPVRGIRLSEDEIRAALPRWERNGTVRNTVGTVTMEQIADMLRKEF